jgi:hypothetical protein
MIYQQRMKEEAAVYFKRPANAFYLLPYKRWARIRSWFLRKNNRTC